MTGLVNGAFRQKVQWHGDGMTPAEGKDHNGEEKIMFICTYNAARSQMAEGYMLAQYGDR